MAYNCIAWAAGDDSQWWWPSEGDYWPEEVPRKTTIEAFIKAFTTLGYAVCPNGNHEPGYEKVAIYTNEGKPTHATRQLATGKWTSKNGRGDDIEIDSPKHVEWDGKDIADGKEVLRYGRIARYMRRRVATPASSSDPLAPPEPPKAS